MQPLMNVPFFLKHREYLWPLAQRLNHRRVANLAAALAAYKFRRSRSSHYPPFLVLLPTFVCNFSCIMCQKNSTEANPYLGATDLDFDHLERILREAGPHTTLVRLVGGEPLAYRDIDRVVDLLDELRAPYCLVTNGSLLDSEIIRKLLRGCVWISMSIDAADADAFTAIRKGGKLERLTENIRELRALRTSTGSRTPLLHASMTTFAYNADQMEPMVRFCREHGIGSLTIGEGIDYHTPFVAVDQLVEHHRDAIRRHLGKARTTAKSIGLPLRVHLPSLKEQAADRRRSECIQLYLEARVSSSLGVVPCIYGDGVLSSLTDRTVAGVWNGDAYVAARRAIRQGCHPSFCATCRSGAGSRPVAPVQEAMSC